MTAVSLQCCLVRLARMSGTETITAAASSGGHNGQPTGTG
jgi:hypothetical protein